MERIFYLLKQSLFVKLALVATLVIGGGNSVWGDTVIFDSSSGENIVSGWSLSNVNYYYSNPKDLYTTSTGTITSDDKITLNSGDTFIIKSKGKYSGVASISIAYSSDGVEWITEKTFSTSTTTLSSNVGDYSELSVNSIIGEFYLKISLANATISLIKIEEFSNQPKLSVSSTSISFGEKTSSASDQSFTVTNSGAGTMNVVISSDDADDNFAMSPISFNLESGESQMVMVFFTIGGEGYNYGTKQATFSVIATDVSTPSLDWDGDKKIIVVSGTSKNPDDPDLILDEDNVTSITKISSQKVLLKYTPSNGWNTFIVPFASKSYMDAIFGSGWKAYSLTGYNNGVLSFTQQTGYLSVNVPFLVYVESAVSHPDGILLEGVSIYSDNPVASKATVSGTKAIFQGTFAPKTYQSGDDWYGVTSSGQVLQAGEGAYVKGYRAYFTGIQPPANGARVSIVLEGDGTTTDLGFVKMVDKDATDVYTLSGQKVQKAGKGLYIVNGRKVVIK